MSFARATKFTEAPAEPAAGNTPAQADVLTPEKPLTAGQIRILKAVSDLLEDPSQRLTIERIAEATFVTPAAVYRHFKNKEQIFESLGAYLESHLLDMPTQEQHASHDAVQVLQQFFTATSTFFQSHPGLARLILGQAADQAPHLAERLQVINSELRKKLAMQCKAVSQAGDLLPKLAPEHAAEVAYGLMMGGVIAQVYRLPHEAMTNRWQIFAQTCVKGKYLSL